MSSPRPDRIGPLPILFDSWQIEDVFAVDERRDRTDQTDRRGIGRTEMGKLTANVMSIQFLAASASCPECRDHWDGERNPDNDAQRGP
jgi:hypothetical protein